MNIAFANPTVRERLSLIAAVVLGPLVMALGYRAHLIYGRAAAAYFHVCICVVPLLIYTAGRFRYLVDRSIVGFRPNSLSEEANTLSG